MVSFGYMHTNTLQYVEMHILLSKDGKNGYSNIKPPSKSMGLVTAAAAARPPPTCSYTSEPYLKMVVVA